MHCGKFLLHPDFKILFSDRGAKPCRPARRCIRISIVFLLSVKINSLEFSFCLLFRLEVNERGVSRSICRFWMSNYFTFIIFLVLVVKRVDLCIFSLVSISNLRFQITKKHKSGEGGVGGSAI